MHRDIRFEDDKTELNDKDAPKSIIVFTLDQNLKKKKKKYMISFHFFG